MAEGDVPNKDSFDYKMGVLQGYDHSMNILNLNAFRGVKSCLPGLKLAIDEINRVRTKFLAAVQVEIKTKLEQEKRDA